MENYNTRVYQLREQLLNTINQQQLPISTIYLILKDLCREAELSLKEVMENEYRMGLDEKNKVSGSDTSDENDRPDDTELNQ